MRGSRENLGLVGMHETMKRCGGTKLDVRWLEMNNLHKLEKKKTWSIMKKGRYRKLENFEDLDHCIGYRVRVQNPESIPPLETMCPASGDPNEAADVGI